MKKILFKKKLPIRFRMPFEYTIVRVLWRNKVSIFHDDLLQRWPRMAIICNNLKIVWFWNGVSLWQTACKHSIFNIFASQRPSNISLKLDNYPIVWKNSIHFFRSNGRGAPILFRQCCVQKWKKTRYNVSFECLKLMGKKHEWFTYVVIFIISQSWILFDHLTECCLRVSIWSFAALVWQINRYHTTQVSA